jgi:hypothetical protein
VGRGRIVSLVKDLLRSPRALAFLGVLATDARLPEAVAELRESGPLPRIQDRALLTDPVGLLRILFATVNNWNWWPDTRPMEPALLGLAEVLQPVAAELMAAPAAASWLDGLDRANQIWVHSTGAVPNERMLRSDWSRLHPWASKPTDGFWTSTALPPLPSTWLLVASDHQSLRQGSVWQIPVPVTARIWEIDGPGAWLELCRRYPQDTTSTYGAEWRAWGSDSGELSLRIGTGWQSIGTVSTSTSEVSSPRKACRSRSVMTAAACSKAGDARGRSGCAGRSGNRRDLRIGVKHSRRRAKVELSEGRSQAQ